MKLLAAGDPFGDIIGTITPFGPIKGDPVAGISALLVFGIRMFMLVVAFVVLIYLLWGAFDWITSGGEKEKVSKAQQKITYAVLGIIIVMVVFAIFGVIAGDVLGILKKDVAGNWIFIFPTFKSP